MTTLSEEDPGVFERLQLASARIPFRLKTAVVWLCIAAVLVWFFSIAEFDSAWMIDKASFVLGGLQYTLLLAVGAIVLACVLALIGSLCRISSNPVLYSLAGFYTSFFRGTPLIVQLFLIYLALPQIAQGIGNAKLTELATLTAFQAGILGLGLNYGAYLTEIFRAGIQSVPHGQYEAAEALGMKYRQRMRRVILPQAARVIIPPTGNEFIAMIKDTALVSFLGVAAEQAEVFRRAGLVGKSDFKNLEAYLLAALIYWGLTAIFTVFQARLERRMSKGYVRGAEKAAPALAVAQGGVSLTPAAAPEPGFGRDDGGPP